MIDRADDVSEIRRLLAHSPVVGLLGPRQSGKTTLARRVAAMTRASDFFDLEDPADLARLADPGLALRPLRRLVVLDEIQRTPRLFEMLRVLADRRPIPARFLILGSASPELLRQSSETLAGRIAFHTLDGLRLSDVGPTNLNRLWVRGGFPRAYAARTDSLSLEWRKNFIRTFLERDLPQLGFRIEAPRLSRFWSMLAHYHGQTWNAAEFARSLALSEKTVGHYLDVLEKSLVVRVLKPWHENIDRRQVKAPKVFIRDSGLLHALLGIPQPARPRTPSAPWRFLGGIHAPAGRHAAGSRTVRTLLLGNPRRRRTRSVVGARRATDRNRGQAHERAPGYEVPSVRH